MSSIFKRIAGAREGLRRAGVPADEADLDARLLAQFVLGGDAARLLTAGNNPTSPEFVTAYDALVERRLAREPLAYITGHKEFWNLRFAVSPAVLVPRPETEAIIEAALEYFPDARADAAIADVCTGSGCLAVALAFERAGARFVATDVSADALDVARQNAVRHHVADRVQFIRTDVLQQVDREFDLIVANPPYVPLSDRPGLQPEVRDHEPAVALFGGHDGLSIVRRLVAESPARLKPGGMLIFELGLGQADAVRALISSAGGLTMIGLKDDLQGIPRVAVARREP
jgi:release factor glutamine methyltransferase